MDREQIIQWALQTSSLVQEQNADVKYLMNAAELEDFAKLVRDDYSNKHAQLWLKRIDEAVKAEREACAKVVEEDGLSYSFSAVTYGQYLAQQIRSRSNI